MEKQFVLELASTFNADLLPEALTASLSADCGTAQIGFTQFTRLSEYLLESAANSEQSAGIVLLLRLEDWLREQLESPPRETALDGWVRQELKMRVDEFLSQVAILAARGKPLWFMACPSRGWAAEHYKLAALFRTFTGLLSARITMVAGVNSLTWPAKLGSQYDDREGDRTNQRPLTPEGFRELGAFLAQHISVTLAAASGAPKTQEAGSASGLAAYLRGLQVQVELAAAEQADVEHIDRLSRTAASFSLTGEKPDISDSEVRELMAAETCLLVKAVDRFSDYGVSGFLVLRAAGDALIVDRFALSCTVLGKQVEHAIVTALGRIASERGLSRLVFGYRAAARNQPMLSFLKSIANEAADGTYEIAAAETELSVKRAAVDADAWKLIAPAVPAG